MNKELEETTVDINTDNTVIPENSAKLDVLEEGSIPILAMRGLVMFPKMVLHFDVGRDKSVLALNHAMKNGRKIFMVAQRDVRVDDPKEKDLYAIGVIAEIQQIVKAQGENLRVVAEGICRGTIMEYTQEAPFMLAKVAHAPLLPVRKSQETKCSALLRTVQELFEEYCNLSPKMPNELVNNVIFDEDYVAVTEYVVGNLPLRLEDKQKILEQSNPLKRLEYLVQVLDRENDILSLEKDIYDRVREQVDKNQREYYLREQLKAINIELNDGENPTDDGFRYMDKIYKLKLADETEEKLIGEARRLMSLPGNSHEGAVIRNYLDVCLALPWKHSTVDKIDIKKAKELLDKEHYGMDKVKERILELLAVRKLVPDIKGQIICLAGPPGVGKTSIAASVAKAMGRKYTRLSLGGVRDESDIRGHRKTYIGAMPGRIINAVKQAKSNNALILLDEIDKLGNDFKGDPSSALLEVLDGEQNSAFVDHYVEVPFDLSHVLFIATANDISAIPAPLRDRMEIIELSGYTRDEKYHIAKNHIITKQVKKHGLKPAQIKITDEAIFELTDYYTREAGVRTLEREIAAICRKTAKDIVAGESKKVVVDATKVREFLGGHRYRPEMINAVNEIGLVNGLAWTSVGGELLQIEVAILEGTGKIQLTGQLGDVMKESAGAAVSYIRGRTEQYGISPSFYKDKDIHIHVPEGAVPKDGPSAGVTMCTALVSALTGIPVKKDVAMTGEITLRGRVMAIGGLKEKAMAAHRAGIKTIIIPKDNQSDIEKIDETIQKEVTFVLAEEIETVLKTALERMPEKTVTELQYTEECVGQK